ncbi:hypothetical protein KDL01_39990 [Actinospica durhamensis]|uniref:Uncharacterized protein n=2 Tax=Actinospica durhamensis TaxID=1508375 RepID=A0A941IS39_9ACTN|nr:hypothetical protein [Actinospica durhamensis]
MTLSHPHFYDSSISIETVVDAGMACRNVSDALLISKYEPAARVELFPVAQTPYGLFFALGADMALYGFHDPHLGLYGFDFVDFLNLLYDDRAPISLIG